ncbi:MAG: hypothetical protein V1874_01705 [Spirochaetota bacterium]
MDHSHKANPDSAYSARKKNQIIEEKFLLRKAIYEMDELSYEKGTRSGDYIIRRIIQEINEELKLFDSHVKTCEIDIKSNSSSLKETLLFFENRYLYTFLLQEKINSLKQELINQQNEKNNQNDIENKEKNYARNINSPFRKDFKKDLINFENALLNNLVPNLSGFLTDLNDFLFYTAANEIVDELAEENIFEDTDNKLKQTIVFYIGILSKLERKQFSREEAQSFAYSILLKTEIKARLLKFGNINEDELEKIVKSSVEYYFRNLSTPVPSEQQQLKTQKIRDESISDEEGENSMDIALKNLKYLADYKDEILEFGNRFAENIPVNRPKRYLYYSSDPKKILLKEIADYLKDSLIFINEWFSIELKKNKDSFGMLNSIAECLPMEIKFYELFATANATGLQEINHRKNVWGDSEQFISKETAYNLIDVIKTLCAELKDAFVKTVISIEMDKPASSGILLKKINIIYDSFENAYKKIINAVRQMEKN